MAKSEIIFGDFVGGGLQIEEGTWQTVTSNSSNSATITGLDTSKWYACYTYQYAPYSNYHNVWYKSELQAIVGIGEVIRLGSYAESNYCTTAFLFKPSATSISANLGYHVSYCTITL